MTKNLKSNDDRPLDAMAGIQPEQVDIMKQKVKSLGLQTAQNEQRILLETCPVDLKIPENKVRVTGSVDSDGTKTYSINNVPFVRIFQATIENSFSEKRTTHTITATTRWEKLEPTE